MLKRDKELMLFALLSSVCCLLVLGFALQNTVALIFCIGLAVLYWIALGLIESTLHAIFRAAVYVYAEVGEAPAGFGGELLSGAMQRK